MSQKIKGGYILLSRKILNNRIMNKPPIYLNVWIYLLLNAQHKNTQNFKRGQGFTSITEIQKALTYNVGYRQIKPSKNQIFDVIEYLRTPFYEGNTEGNNEGNYENKNETTMITTTKTTRGFFYFICKYDVYQTSQNYENNNDYNNENNNENKTEGNNEGFTKANTINKNVKNDKNNILSNDNIFVEKQTKSKFIKPTLEEIRAYCIERNNKVNPEKFFNYYESNGWKVGKNPMKSWKACVRTWEQNNFDDKKSDKQQITNVFLRKAMELDEQERCD